MSTYTPIASQTLGSSAASVTFSSLPQNYTDLILVMNSTLQGNYNEYVRINNDTSSLYSVTYMTGNGSTTLSSRASNQSNGFYFDAYGGSSTTAGVGILNFQNYSNTATFKTVLSRYSNATSEAMASVGLYRSTNAINTITIYVGTNNFASGSTFTLYGVAAGNSSAKATGGNIVTTDGSYWYHAFTTTGTFTPSSALTCDYVVVAGGAGGGYSQGGGGLVLVYIVLLMQLIQLQFM